DTGRLHCLPTNPYLSLTVSKASCARGRYWLFFVFHIFVSALRSEWIGSVVGRLRFRFRLCRTLSFFLLGTARNRLKLPRRRLFERNLAQTLYQARGRGEVDAIVVAVENLDRQIFRRHHAQAGSGLRIHD